MECKDFQKLINDFIFDKIEYSEDLKEFLNHAKTCKNCGEELELYYTIRRGLGDVKALMAVRKVLMLHRNWKILLIFMMNILKNKEKRKKAAIISVIIAMLMIIFVIVCLYLNTIGII